MNDIAKLETQTRLNKAIESEGLKINEAAAALGIQATYISMIRNEKQWDKCPSYAWESVLKWVNSGQTLKEYSEKHGKVLTPEKHTDMPPKNTINASDIKSDPKLLKEAKQLKQKESIRPSRGQMVEMLLEEKELLKSEIEAIDILLKHYIS